MTTIPTPTAPANNQPQQLPHPSPEVLELAKQLADEMIREQRAKGGRIGGRSRSPKKVAAARVAIAKARAARHKQHRLMAVVPGTEGGSNG